MLYVNLKNLGLGLYGYTDFDVFYFLPSSSLNKSKK